MNTKLNPSAESPSNVTPGRNPCFGTDPQVAALNVLLDDEHSYLLPYGHFTHSEIVPNPALEKEPDAPPQKLLIRFAAAEVVVLGCGLKAIDRAIQKFELKFVKAIDRRYAATLNAHVAAVSITFTKETP